MKLYLVRPDSGEVVGEIEEGEVERLRAKVTKLRRALNRFAVRFEYPPPEPGWARDEAYAKRVLAETEPKP